MCDIALSYKARCRKYMYMCWCICGSL